MNIESRRSQLSDLVVNPEVKYSFYQDVKA